ncbi:MAG: hypothetical protein VB122_06715 [Erysipelotrichales bacterium]|nr:hypothetical protein [Erysipelotrichales bacterium]
MYKNYTQFLDIISKWQFFSIVLLILLFIIGWIIIKTNKDDKSEKSSTLDFIAQLCFILSITIGIIIITYSLGINLQFIDKDLTQNSTGFHLLGTADGWLSFIGALIGGILTMLGVILTLNYQERIRKKQEILRNSERLEENRIKYLPYFTLSHSNTYICSFSNIPKLEVFNVFSFDNSTNFEQNKDSVLYIHVKNASDNPAIDLKFIGRELSIKNSDDGRIIYHKNTDLDTFAHFVPAKDHIPIAINVPDIKGPETIVIQLLFNLEYSDNFGHYYEQPGNLMIFLSFERDINDNFDNAIDKNRVQFLHDMSAPKLRNK